MRRLVHQLKNRACSKCMPCLLNAFHTLLFSLNGCSCTPSWLDEPGLTRLVKLENSIHWSWLLVPLQSSGSRCSSTIPQLIDALLHKTLPISPNYDRYLYRKRTPKHSSWEGTSVLTSIPMICQQPSQALIRFDPSCASLDRLKHIDHLKIHLREHQQRLRKRRQHGLERTWNWVCHDWWRLSTELCLLKHIKPKSGSNGFQVRKWDWFWTESLKGCSARQPTRPPRLYQENFFHLLTKRSRIRLGKLPPSCFHAFLPIKRQLVDGYSYRNSYSRSHEWSKWHHWHPPCSNPENPHCVQGIS